MKSREIAAAEIAGSWAERCAHWRDNTPTSRTISLRRRTAQPLVLTGHGVSLRIEKGALLIRDGLTHYPQERSEHRIFPGEPTRPTRIILLDGSGSLTFDVIDWLRAQDVALIRIDWTGAAIVCGACGYAADAKVWRRQDALRADPARRMSIARRLILEKLERSIQTLAECVPETPRRTYATGVIAAKRRELRRLANPTFSELHGIEGRAARVYFDAWAGTPLNWKIAKRRPIPDAWRTIGQRQSLATGKKGKNYRATHPVNAILNYAYAVLEGQMRIDVIAAGYDPLAGFLHQSRRGSPALALDLMEPMRPVVDAAVLSLVQRQTFNGADFTLRADGVVRLNPQLARRVAQIAAEAINVAPSPLVHIPT